MFGNKYAVTISPFSFKVQDRLYVTPGFGFGESPYTLLTFSYEVFEN
jgi:hypothetical protein